MGEWLKMRNFQVVEAKDGWEAVAVALRERPNLILMDLNLPVLDGAEVTCLLREHEELHDVPVMAITAHDTADARADASDVGCMRSSLSRSTLTAWNRSSTSTFTADVARMASMRVRDSFVKRAVLS